MIKVGDIVKFSNNLSDEHALFGVVEVIEEQCFYWVRWFNSNTKSLMRYALHELVKVNDD